MGDDALVFELAQGFVEAEELDVGAADIVGEVLVVAAVGGVGLLEDGGEEDGRLGADAEAFRNDADVVGVGADGIL